jgi:uncharacterized membrane protein
MGYGPRVAFSHEGYPVYLYTDPHSQMRTYVVVLPDGRAFYSDARGRIVATPAESDKQVAGALVGGLTGLALFGPVGAIVGAFLGAIAGNELSKKGGA